MLLERHISNIEEWKFPKSTSWSYPSLNRTSTSSVTPHRAYGSIPQPNLLWPPPVFPFYSSVSGLWGLGHLIKVYGARLGICEAFFFLLRIGLARIGKMLTSSGPLLALSPSRLIECELSSLGPCFLDQLTSCWRLSVPFNSCIVPFYGYTEHPLHPDERWSRSYSIIQQGQLESTLGSNLRYQLYSLMKLIGREQAILLQLLTAKEPMILVNPTASSLPTGFGNKWSISFFFIWFSGHPLLVRVCLWKSDPAISREWSRDKACSPIFFEQAVLYRHWGRISGWF